MEGAAVVSSIVIIGDDDGFEMEGAAEVVSSIVIIGDDDGDDIGDDDGDDLGDDDGGADGAAVGDAIGFVLRHSVDTDRDSEGDEVGEDDTVCFHLPFSSFRVRVVLLISSPFTFATGSCSDTPLFLVVAVLPR